jgi:cell division protein DivIC
MSRNRAERARKRKIFSLIVIIGFAVTVLVLFLAGACRRHSEAESERKALLKEKEKLVREQEKLIKYEEYTKSDEYIESTAEEKLGMIKGNWIIFREKN